MKLYANNRLLAEQLLETVFAILRNERLQPVDCLAMAYDVLTGGIDASPVQQVALHDWLQQALAAHDRQPPSESTGTTWDTPE